MMMKKFLSRITFLMLFVSAMFTGCEEDRTNDNINPDNALAGTGFDYIRYGTSFNMCLGYCISQVEITESGVIFVAKGWNFSDTIPDISGSQDISSGEWNTLNSKIDIDSFNALPEFIGCPDCADGGAEWIEISKEGSTHKVTFEYGTPPTEVASYINLLRDYMPTDTGCN